MHDVLLILTNVPDEACAERLTRHLLETSLAACVNRFAPVQSSYRWQGELETALELPLLIKTSAARYPDVEAAIRELHPYDVPEILAWPASAGYAPYLRWVIRETTPALRA